MRSGVCGHSIDGHTNTGSLRVAHVLGEVYGE